MLKLGEFNLLKVDRKVDFGLYLHSEDGDVLMPAKYVPEGTEIGDMLPAFIYRDSEDRIIATTLIPKAKANEFAVLQVTDENNNGSFMDIGLEKDLFVPFKNQKDRMQIGKHYAVYVYIDEITDRLVGTAKLGNFIENEEIDLQPGDKTNLLIIGETELGFKAIADNKYLGLLYRNEVFKPLQPGDRLKGYVFKIREDNKLDLRLQQPGYNEVLSSKELILNKLIQNNGKLYLTDKSSAEEIYEQLGMSKKNFKKTIGSLYKDRKISLENDHIKLIE